MKKIVCKIYWNIEPFEDYPLAAVYDDGSFEYIDQDSPEDKEDYERDWKKEIEDERNWWNDPIERFERTGWPIYMEPVPESFKTAVAITRYSNYHVEYLAEGEPWWGIPPRKEGVYD